jgi:hypothetical protein
MIVTSGGPSGLGASLARGFEDLGWRTELVSEPWVRVRRLSGPALAATDGLPRSAVDEGRVIERAQALRPSLILVIKGSFVHPDLVAEMSRLAPTVCWNPDHPFDWALSNRGGYMVPALPHYHAYVTWSTSHAAVYADMRDRVYRIPFGCDPTLHAPTAGTGEAAGRVVFIGIASRQRAAMLARLRHLEPLVYGTGWDRTQFDVRGAVYGAAFAAVAGEATWCLNLLHAQNRDSHNMRSFELLACGARQLTLETSDHRIHLAGSGAVLAATWTELVEIAATTPSTAPVEVRLEGNTYADRCRELVGCLARDGLLGAAVPE